MRGGTVYQKLGTQKVGQTMLTRGNCRFGKKEKESNSLRYLVKIIMLNIYLKFFHSSLFPLILLFSLFLTRNLENI